MGKNSLDLRLVLVADLEKIKGRSIDSLVAEAVRGGVTCVRLRARGEHANEESLVKIGKRLVAILSNFKVPLIVDEHVELAFKIGALGVHLHPGETTWFEARNSLGPNAIIGLTVETPDAAESAINADVDYLELSPMYATPASKHRPFGLAGLKRVCTHTNQRILVAGGITVQNASDAMTVGADGVAVLSAICNAADPKAEAARLRTAVNDGLSARARAQAEKRNRPTYKRVLTIAGSDSGGGAGIQADLKTFAALGCYGTSAITALTAQNTVAVRSVFPVSPEFVTEQIETVLDDIGTDAIKIGMLHDRHIIRAVARALRARPQIPVVLDPVMISSTGEALLPPEAVTALVEELLPRVNVLTPNIPEAAAILNREILRKEDMEKAAGALLHLLSHTGPKAVIIKGGHLAGPSSDDCLRMPNATSCQWLTGERIETANTHGTGCTFSAAIAAHLALGYGIEKAARKAKDYLTASLREGAKFRLGEGSGPLQHMHATWKQPIPAADATATPKPLDRQK